MAERIDTPFTNEHFIAFCEKMLGQPYWFGTCLYKCRASLLASKSRQYPDAYASSRQSRYQQDIEQKKVAADCIGACKGYAWTGGGIGVLESIGTDKTYASKYGSKSNNDTRNKKQVHSAADSVHRQTAHSRICPRFHGQ